MEKNDIIQVKDEFDVNTNKVVMYNSINDVVGLYKKTELKEFDSKIKVFIEHVIEVIDDFSYAVDEKIDEVVGLKLLELYEKIVLLMEKQKSRENRNISRESTLEKLKSMGKVEDSEDLDMSVGMKEFRLDDYDREYFRGDSSKKRRGSLSVFFAIFIGISLLFIVLFIKFVSI